MASEVEKARTMAEKEEERNCHEKGTRALHLDGASARAIEGEGHEVPLMLFIESLTRNLLCKIFLSLRREEWKCSACNIIT